MKYKYEHSIPIQKFIFRFVDGFRKSFYLLFSRLHLSTDKIKTLDLFRIVWYIVYICYFTKINHHAEELKMFLLRFDFTILKLQKDGESQKKKPKIFEGVELWNRYE